MCAINPKPTKSTKEMVAWKTIEQVGKEEYRTMFQHAPLTGNVLRAHRPYIIQKGESIDLGVSAFVYKKDAIAYARAYNHYTRRIIRGNICVMRVVIPKGEPRIMGMYESNIMGKEMLTVISNLQELGEIFPV
jgi:hypothetical protein